MKIGGVGGVADNTHAQNFLEVLGNDGTPFGQNAPLRGKRRGGVNFFEQKWQL